MFENVLQVITSIVFLTIFFNTPTDTDDDKSYARKLTILKLTGVVLLVCLVAAFFREIV